MTTTLDAVNAKKKPEPTGEAAAAAELVRMAKEKGWSLTGPDGLLKHLTKTVPETALNEEMTEHLGYEKHDPAGRESGNVRRRHPRQNGAHRVDRAGGHRGAAGPGRHASAADRGRNGNADSPESMRSCCRCMRRV